MKATQILGWPRCVLVVNLTKMHSRIVEMQYNLSRADSDRNPIKFYGHIKNLESTARAELFYLVKCKCCDTSRRIEKFNLKKMAPVVQYLHD